MTHTQRARVARLRARRGAGLAVAIMFTIAMGALATSAIMLTGSASLVSRSLNHERDLKYAADAALEWGKSRVNALPTSLPDTGFVALQSNKTVTNTNGSAVPNVVVNTWLGKSGSTTGEFGTFVSVVAQSLDAGGSKFVRRLEMTQESFAKFAYFTVNETNNGSTIYFSNSDVLWGPVFSDDVIHISANSGSQKATFHNSVGTAKTISGISYANFIKGYQQNQKPVALPTDTYLQFLSGLATSGHTNFTAPNSGDETQVLMRIEFSPADLNGNGDSTGANEGFVRVYKANTGNQAWLRGDFPGYTANITTVLNCGDWHPVAGSAQLKFFPAAVHRQEWFKKLDSLYWISQGKTAAQSEASAKADSAASITTIMNSANARCYLGGDPHLVAAARAGVAGQKGGDDTTFTATDNYGAWLPYPGTVDTAVSNHRPADANYLFPLYRGLNPGSNGVIYVSGTTGVSGVVRGQITLYASGGSVIVLDGTRYTNDPTKGACGDMLGLIASNNVVVADNGLLDPQQISNNTYKSLNTTNYLTLQAVVMALNTSFTVENYSSGPSSASSCQGTANGRGCLYLTGGLIQKNRGPVGLLSGEGYLKQYAYDQCALLSPPPYFPTTGRFLDNRYFELSPVGFNPGALFASLRPHA